jgi:hypothetical protein
MQTLGLSDAMPRSEGRLKSLFWPSVQSSNDVDYLGTQGYWVCAIGGLISGVFLVFLGSPWIGLLVFVFIFSVAWALGNAVLMRQVASFVAYFVEMLVAGLGFVKIVLCALLLANFRATWMASRWKPDSPKPFHRPAGTNPGATSSRTNCPHGSGRRCDIRITTCRFSIWGFSDSASPLFSSAAE